MQKGVYNYKYIGPNSGTRKLDRQLYRKTDKDESRIGPDSGARPLDRQIDTLAESRIGPDSGARTLDRQIDTLPGSWKQDWP